MIVHKKSTTIGKKTNQPAAQLHLCSAVYQRWRCYKYTSKSLRRRTIELQLLWLHCIVI